MLILLTANFHFFKLDEKMLHYINMSLHLLFMFPSYAPYCVYFCEAGKDFS